MIRGMMKLPNICRHRRRNTLLLFVGIVSSCLVFLALRDNLSGTSSEIQKRLYVTESYHVFHPHTTRPHRETTRLTSASDIPAGEYSFTRTHESMIRLNGLSRPTVKPSDEHLMFVRQDSGVKPKWNKELYYNASSMPDHFRRWREECQKNMCNNKVIGFDHEFLEARDMIIDRRFCTSEMEGGELIQHVITQAEASEYYRFEMGCFKVACSKRPSYYFNGENHLTQWLYSLDTQHADVNADLIMNEFTIAITRYEYANLYHTMTDWYNAFLVMQFFNHTSYNTNILIIDSHPYGVLDPVWNQLFNSTIRIASLPRRTLFKHLVWGILGYNSQMKIFVSPTPPLYEDFRNFFLSAYDINTERQIDCKRLSILFVWRHDYVAHPRNPSGFVSRKIRNEEQLIRYIKRRNSNSVVTGIQMDAYTMRQQLQYIADADIFVGMHGAGMTHAVFLNKKSALIELVPNYWSSMSEHFKAICVWRGLIYKQWANTDPRNEYPDKSTNIPPQIMNTLIKNTIRELCGQTDTH